MNKITLYSFALSLLTVIIIGCSEKEASNHEDFQQQIIFPYQDEHVHGSTIAELPNGDLITAWFQGSGERWAMAMSNGATASSVAPRPALR